MSRLTDEEAIRLVITAVLFTEEAYSVDIWKSWKHCGGDRNKKTGMPKVQRALKAMETEGLIAGRDVLGEEHKGSVMMRRYYKWK